VICIEVKINGENSALAGVGQLGVLSAILSWTHLPGIRTAETNFELGGLADDVHYSWLHRSLNVGDRIEIRIKESETADDAVTFRRDSNGDELSERRYYERLREKYG
jgi:hypothetical protein